MNLRFDLIYTKIPFILHGFFVTMQYTIIAFIIGSFIGILLALMKNSVAKKYSYIASIYISIFRGTPLLVQLYLIYFSTPQLIGYKITVFEAGILAFSLNSAAYVAEIIRSGINSICKGQFEAANSLGIPYHKAMLHIIMPQVIRNMLPALVNELINLLKESALISSIGGMDLLKRANIVKAETFLCFEPLLVVALIYYVVVLVLAKCAKFLEKRLQYSD